MSLLAIHTCVTQRFSCLLSCLLLPVELPVACRYWPGECFSRVQPVTHSNKKHYKMDLDQSQ